LFVFFVVLPFSIGFCIFSALVCIQEAVWPLLTGRNTPQYVVVRVRIHGSASADVFRPSYARFFPPEKAVLFMINRTAAFSFRL